ncbi:flagellar M-ring protein FliF [Nibricoccus aquaticus]|uniref:Flagellar M-ring protein n=1 Tax=Nibricoccus aquaticus TaxID=2576891 RepID=A0A290Q4R7_9BACT|nr:flagellar basal-body MS-ring/collar protein FliF [Nibricoccus aquaticus]ATC63675.1 flagellar M-ring protein FliF [Nibricoccus aquaticus]
MKNFTQSLVTLWKELGLNQRVSIIISALVVTIGLVALVMWSRRPDLQLLYGRLSEKDAAAIVSQLQAQNIPHKVTNGGATVYVPADQVYRLRMEMAAKGVPSGDGVGFEIFDKGQFGLSDFVQRTNYLRALQGELARTISQLEGVRSARVMIVQPENRLLLTDQNIKPTASVFVELASSRLDVDAVNSIRHLVANAVQGLQADAVAVVDHRGRVLSEDLKQDPTLGTASSQMRYRQQVEEYFSKKIESMLIPVLGSNNAIVRVSAEIDSEASTVMQEKYDPEGQVVRSQTVSEDLTNSTEARNGGTVGITANTPDRDPAAAAAAQPPSAVSESNRKNRTTTFEIGRSVTNVTRQPGTVRNLTASVFIAERGVAADGKPMKRTPEELQSLRQIVINALGLKASPGVSVDSLVTLEEIAFQTEPIAQQIQQIQTETRVQGWIETASRYVAVFIAAAVLFIFWKTLKKQKFEVVPMELLSAPPDAAQRALQNNGVLTPELLTELIRQKPANIGTALRDWVAVKKG